MDGDEAGNASALNKDLAHAMAGCLGRGHAHVDAGRRNDGLVMDVEAVREEQQFARAEIRPNLFGIQLGRCLIGNQNHHHIGPLGDICNCAHLKAGLLRLGDGLRARRQAHLHLNAGVLEVESVCVALGAVADDSYLLALNER